MQLSFTIPLHYFSIHCGLYHFCYWRWQAWGFMSFQLFQCCSNLIKPDAICWSFFNSILYSVIPFILLIHQLFHVLLSWIFNPFLVCNHFIRYCFQTVWPRYILSIFYCLLCYSKISLGCLGLFKSLAHFFCFFPFSKEITLFSFCLLFLYSFHVSVNFSFFQFAYFFFLSLTASATSSFHHHVSLWLHGPFDHSHMTCAVLFPSVQ